MNKHRHNIQEELDALYTQLGYELNAGARLRLQREIDALQTELETAERSQPRSQASGDDGLCLEIIRARARLNTLIDVAELLGDMPPWLHERIQREHDLLHDAKVAILRQ